MGWSFRFNDLPSYTEFTTLYDQYKIRGVQLTIWLQANSFSSKQILSNAPTAATPDIQLPMLYYVRDYDDATGLTLPAMQQYPGMKMRQMDRPIKIFVRPKPLLMLYESSIATGYGTAYRNTPWVDINHVDVPHYGLKMIIDPGTSYATESYKVKCMAKYYFTLRGVR